MRPKKDNYKRTQVQFTINQHDTLTKEAQNKGIPLAELLRRIVDEYYDKKR